jgi:hypothetical protein
MANNKLWKYQQVLEEGHTYRKYTYKYMTLRAFHIRVEADNRANGIFIHADWQSVDAESACEMIQDVMKREKVYE